MRKLTRILSYLSALLGGLLLVRPSARYGGSLVGIVWLLRLVALAFAPIVGLMGALGALLGLARKDRRALLAGLFASAVAARYVVRVSAPHPGFERAFGPDWRSRIPPQMRGRMMPERWSWRVGRPPDAPWQRDVVLAVRPETGGEPLLADVWQPPDGVFPSGLAIIYLHGSGWHYTDKDWGTRPFFRHLAGQGHVIVDVAYGLAPVARLHEQVGDVKRAIAWMKTCAGEYGVNPERVVLMGASAGGHLALLAAYTPNHAEFQPQGVSGDTSVRAVVSYYGPPDLRAAQEHFGAHFGDVLTGRTVVDRVVIACALGGIHAISAVSGMRGEGASFLPPDGRLVGPVEMLPGLLGGTPDEVPDLYDVGSPVNYVGAHCPPTLLLQGEHDIGIHPEPVRRLHRALCEAGVPSVYVELRGADHAFDFPMGSPAGQAATYDTERFLALMV